jgi:hypothetical protein
MGGSARHKELRQVGVLHHCGIVLRRPLRIKGARRSVKGGHTSLYSKPGRAQWETSRRVQACSPSSQPSRSQPIRQRAAKTTTTPPFVIPAEYGWRAVASAAQMISRRLSASGRPYAPWRSAWRRAIRGGDAHPAGQCHPGRALGGCLRRERWASGARACIRSGAWPSVQTSGDDGLAWDQRAVTGVRGLALLRSATWAGGLTAPAGTGLIRGVGRDAEDR